MTDETPRTLSETQADHLARQDDATFGSVLAAGVAVLGVMQRDYPARLERLKSAHEAWSRAGRPKDVRPTAAPATEREVVPAPPAPPSIEVPDPATATMKDLVAAGPVAFNEFKTRHPDAYDVLARGVGLPLSRSRP